MTYMRETSFNLIRAKFCAKECHNKMTEIEAYQQKAISKALKRVVAECPPVS